MTTHPARQTKPKVAAIVTEYRHNSHAEVIIGRLFGRMGFDPQIEVVSIYVDQFPDHDMSTEEAARAGVKICATIRDAILEAHRHGIGGVVIIGEHGQYPCAPNGQKMYPRRKFMEETLLALDEVGVRAPIFSDKHLSWNMDDALWMYEALRQRGIPFMGGSSIPLVPLVPSINKESLLHAREFLAVSFGGTEDYGYHAWEALQSLAEQRAGGETGVKSVRAIQGKLVWDEMDRGEWPEQLMLLALRTYSDSKEGHPRTRVSGPVLMRAEYVDGLTGYVLQLPGEVEQWSVAWRGLGGEDGAVRFDSDLDRPFRHFETLTKKIENLVMTGRSPVPAERTLLTTGLIHYTMESLFNNVSVPTPMLQMKYSTDYDVRE